MPTNANTFNSRVTSEALEAKFRQVFPAQGGAELVQDLFASGVIQPVVDFSSVAEGSVLPENLQTAWDLSTGNTNVTNTTTTVINNTGFWQIDLNLSADTVAGATSSLNLTDGLTNKVIWRFQNNTNSTFPVTSVSEGKFVVFVKAGESITATSGNGNHILSIWYRQIADVNGNLVNPLGFTFS